MMWKMYEEKEAKSGAAKQYPFSGRPDENGLEVERLQRLSSALRAAFDCACDHALDLLIQ